MNTFSDKNLKEKKCIKEKKNNEGRSKQCQHMCAYTNVHSQKDMCYCCRFSFSLAPLSFCFRLLLINPWSFIVTLTCYIIITGLFLKFHIFAAKLVDKLEKGLELNQLVLPTQPFFSYKKYKRHTILSEFLYSSFCFI